jgi:hypothetical protein
LLRFLPFLAIKNGGITGEVAKALFAKAGELLAEPPTVVEIDIIASK